MLGTGSVLLFLATVATGVSLWFSREERGANAWCQRLLETGLLLIFIVLSLCSAQFALLSMWPSLTEHVSVLSLRTVLASCAFPMVLICLSWGLDWCTRVRSPDRRLR